MAKVVFGEDSDHDYLKALVMAGVLSGTVEVAYPIDSIELPPGSSEPGYDAAGRPLDSGDPRRHEEAAQKVADAVAEIDQAAEDAKFATDKGEVGPEREEEAEPAPASKTAKGSK